MKDALIGRQLANYRIEHLLGRGGMARVYYGTDVKLMRPVAIKVLDERLQANQAYAQRFVREAQTVAAWRHENVLQVYYADETDGYYYFVTEYIDGADLGKMLDEYTRLGELASAK
jgi:serine/threonine protein kinase